MTCCWPSNACVLGFVILDLFGHTYLRAESNKNFHVPVGKDKGHVDLFGLMLFINNSSATTAPGTVPGHPKANEAQPLSTIPVQARCRARRQLLPSHTESEKLWMYTLCRHSVEIRNVSNMLQSRCIKCDWCGLLREHLSKPQNYVLFLWWSYRIILYNQKKKKQYGSIYGFFSTPSFLYMVVPFGKGG